MLPSTELEIEVPPIVTVATHVGVGRTVENDGVGAVVVVDGKPVAFAS